MCGYCGYQGRLGGDVLIVLSRLPTRLFHGTLGPGWHSRGLGCDPRTAHSSGNGVELDVELTGPVDFDFHSVGPFFVHLAPPCGRLGLFLPRPTFAGLVSTSIPDYGKV